jgi:hypothetical protein
VTRRRTPLVIVAVALAATAASPAVAHDVTAHSWASFRAAVNPAASAPEPALTATPRARCGPGSRPEPGMQGRVPKDEVDAGRADEGYWCNVKRIGHTGATGGFRVHRYVDKAGHECAYYDTALLFPTNALNLSLDPTGVAVLDMSDPSHPVRTETLLTPAMQTPHESLNISVQRGVLAAVMGNPAKAPGGVDVYDISGDCRHPVEMAAAFPATPFGHESGMAPDGLTFYPSSASEFSAVDISDPRLPKELWRSGDFATHGLSISEDGRRGYLATIGTGLVIIDLSEVQARKPDPQVTEISRLTWSTMTIPQIPIPVTIKGRPYVVEVDEYSSTEDGQFTGHGDRVGAARIIDISDERHPFVVSNLRLQVHQKENRAEIADDYGASSPVQGYAAHYCNVPRTVDPGIVACSMILSGLRVFDIRDPKNPREIAYHVAPPSNISETGGPVIDERANWAMSQPAFVPERGEIWYSDGTSGFWALRVSPDVWPFPTTAPNARAVDRSIDVRVKAPRLASDSLRGRRIRLRIRGKKGLPAISHFVLQYRRTGRGTKRVYKTLRPRLAKSTKRVTFKKGKVGQTYLFRITAIGTNGKRSVFHHSRTVFPYDDQGKGRHYSRGWRRVKNGRAWLGGYSQTSRRGATMRFTTRGGGRVYLVARTGPNGGRAIVGRGTKRRIVSFRSAKRRNRRVVTVVNRTDKRAYRFTLRVLSGTVTVDGIGVRRR